MDKIVSTPTFAMGIPINRHYSPDITLSFGVPQGSVLGPLLFTMYVTPFADIANRFGLYYHFYADESQLYVSFELRTNSQNAARILKSCTSVIKSWIKFNMLKLNDEKTELIIFGSSYSIRKFPSLSLKISNIHINSSDSVKI